MCRWGPRQLATKGARRSASPGLLRSGPRRLEPADPCVGRQVKLASKAHGTVVQHELADELHTAVSAVEVRGPEIARGPIEANPDLRPRLHEFDERVAPLELLAKVPGLPPRANDGLDRLGLRQTSDEVDPRRSRGHRRRRRVL